MQVEDIRVTDTPMIDLFIENRNYAYRERSNEQIPYRPIGRDKLLCTMKNNAGCILGCFEEGKLIGGACCFQSTKDGISFWNMSHIWVSPQKQGKGIGKTLLLSIEEKAKRQDVQALSLNVANNYEPAMQLYKKMGFRPIMVYANEPGTYFFVRLIKEIPPYKYSVLKRLCNLGKSKIIFGLLYHQDSTPRKLSKMIYEKIKK